MHLLRLSLTAIGPFAGTEEIDFARLGASGLFLLDGPTGAGKSTVIDAVCFALYGRVAQAGADPGRIRSHHAAAEVESVVVLDFETQSGVYRVRRTPAFTRIARSGSSTPVHPTVKLWRLSGPDQQIGEGDLLSAKMREAEDEITRAVGLTRDQFVQTVVLPQGEFATFLRAKSEDKALLLERLFGADLIRRVQNDLVDGARAARERRAAAAQTIDRALHDLLREARLEPDGDVATSLRSAIDTGPGTADALSPVLDDLVRGLAATTERAALVAAECAEVDNRARLDLEQAQALAIRRARLRDLLALSEALTERAEAIGELRAELAAAHRARGPHSSAERLDRARAEAAQALVATETAQARLGARLAELPVDTAGAGDLAIDPSATAGDSPAQVSIAVLIDRLTRSRGRLEVALATERTIPALSEAARRATAELAELDVTLTAARAALADLPSALERAEADLAATGALAACLPERAAALAQAQARAEAAGAWLTEQGHRDRAESTLTTARTEELAARRLVADLTAARIAGIAAELGAHLEPGCPCPVCGALEHPQPAHPADDAVTPDQLRSAEAAAHQAAADTEVAQLRAAEHRDRCAALAVLSGGLDVEQAQAARSVAAAAHLEASTALGRLPELTECRSGLIAQREQHTEQVDALTTRRADALAQTEAAQASLAQAHTAVDLARAGLPSVRDHDRALAAAIEAAAVVASCRAGQSNAEQAAIDRRTELDEELHSAGFDSDQQWAQAVREPDWLTDAAARLAEHDRAVTETAAALTGPEFDGLEPDATDDLADLTAAAQVAADARRDAEQAATTARNRVADTHRARLALEQARRGGARVLAETRDALRVGTLVGGTGTENQLNLDLVKYVLVRRFTEVLDAANTQLGRIGAGRYVLSHTDAKQGNARSGLGIQVLDTITERVREVGTLSGGETFYVSLALALALAETVRAESGGVELGTLFVDEGFGALDPDVLDEVLRTLERLRADGRTVGVVSHVPELKARIAERVEVRPVAGSPGSTLSMTA